MRLKELREIIKDLPDETILDSISSVQYSRYNSEESKPYNIKCFPTGHLNFTQYNFRDLIEDIINLKRSKKENLKLCLNSLYLSPFLPPINVRNRLNAFINRFEEVWKEYGQE